MTPKVQPLTPEFLEEEVVIRGVTYKFRELSIGEYDELVRKATTPRPNPITGIDEDVVDNTVLLRLMVIACAVEPRLTAETLSRFPMRAAIKVNQTVNRMHYGDEPASEKKDEEGEDGKKGND